MAEAKSMVVKPKKCEYYGHDKGQEQLLSKSPLPREEKLRKLLDCVNGRSPNY